MDVIFTYLDSMFAPYPTSPKLEEAKTELRGMMEDAYNGFIDQGLSKNEAVGKVITEFGNLDDLAPILGISAEIHPGAAPVNDSKSKYPPVTLEEAQGFAESRRSTQLPLTIAVVLFVLSPISIFIATILAGEDNNAVAFGLIPLLAIIAIGVIITVGVDQKRSAYKHISTYKFKTNPVVTNWAKNLEKAHANKRRLAVQIAVTLWILAAAPIILMSTAFPNLGGEGNGSVIGVIFTLIFVASGLLVFLPSNWASEVHSVLSKEDGDSVIYESEENSIIGVVASFYWPLMVIIYLGWSFIWNAWGISWIVWPLAGLLFAGFAAGFSAIARYKSQKQQQTGI